MWGGGTNKGKGGGAHIMLQETHAKLKNPFPLFFLSRRCLIRGTPQHLQAAALGADTQMSDPS